MSENVLLASSEFKYRNYGLVYMQDPVPKEFEHYRFDRIYDFTRMDEYDKQKYFGFVDQVIMELDKKVAFVSTIEIIYSISLKAPIIDFPSAPYEEFGQLMIQAHERSYKDHVMNLNGLKWNRPAMIDSATEEDKFIRLIGYLVKSFGTVKIIEKYLDVPPPILGNTIDFWGPMHTQKAKKQIKQELFVMPEDGCFSPREVLITSDRYGTTNLTVEITKVCCDQFEDKMRAIISKHATSRDSE